MEVRPRGGIAPGGVALPPAMSLFDSFGRLAGRARDAAIQTAFNTWVRRKTQAIRHMTNLRIDSRERRISLELDLVGEPEPLRVEVGEYVLSDEGGRTWIEVRGVRTSKPWLDILAAEILKGRRFEVPGAVRAVL